MKKLLLTLTIIISLTGCKSCVSTQLVSRTLNLRDRVVTATFSMHKVVSTRFCNKCLTRIVK